MEIPMTPCRLMPTRRCPDVFDNGCATGACARYESDDETPWLKQIELEAKGLQKEYVEVEKSYSHPGSAE